MPAPSISTYQNNVKNSLPGITFSRRRAGTTPTEACLTSGFVDDALRYTPMPSISGPRRRTAVSDASSTKGLIQTAGPTRLTNILPEIVHDSQPEVEVGVPIMDPKILTAIFDGHYPFIITPPEQTKPTLIIQTNVESPNHSDSSPNTSDTGLKSPPYHRRRRISRNKSPINDSDSSSSDGRMMLQPFIF